MDGERLQAVVSSLDDVPESIREHYEEDPSGDGFILKVDGHFADASGLKKVNTSLKAEVAKLKRRLAKFADVGDPDDVAAMRERLAELEEASATGAGDWERAKAQLTDRHNREQAKSAERVRALESRLERVLKHDAALQAVTAANGIPEALLHHVVDHIELVEDDEGELVARARGLDGTEVETIGALVQQMRESQKYDWGFKPNGATGGGAAGRRASSAGVAAGKRSGMSVADKAAFISEHGSEAFLALPK